MILRPFFMVFSNNDSHITRIDFLLQITRVIIPNHGKNNHITKPLNIICLLAERILNNHLVSRILDILALKKSKTK